MFLNNFGQSLLYLICLARIAWCKRHIRFIDRYSNTWLPESKPHILQLDRCTVYTYLLGSEELYTRHVENMFSALNARCEYCNNNFRVEVSALRNVDVKTDMNDEEMWKLQILSLENIFFGFLCYFNNTDNNPWLVALFRTFSLILLNYFQYFFFLSITHRELLIDL